MGSAHYADAHGKPHKSLSDQVLNQMSKLCVTETLWFTCMSLSCQTPIYGEGKESKELLVQAPDF